MLCLRIHRGLPLHGDDQAWVRAKADQAAQFFANDLAAHFKAEEGVLFPAMRDFTGAHRLLSELLSEHRELERLAARLDRAELAELVAALGQLADLLEAHIRKEERELFPLYEKEASAELAARVGSAIKDIIGDAIEPSSSELLK
jgi:iron-sulfur cluster repair protein YtfE (RIC family)